MLKIISFVITISAMVIFSSCSKTPEACFTADKGKTAKVNEEVQFNAACSKDADTFTWNFGDGTTGTGSSTKHKYATAANYYVTLTVSNKKKSATMSQDLTIAP